MINKAREVRNALGLSPGECGQLLLKAPPKSAYDQWTQWESGVRKPSRPTDRLFDVILALKLAQDLKTPGAHRALETVIKLISEDDDD